MGSGVWGVGSGVCGLGSAVCGLRSGEYESKLNESDTENAGISLKECNFESTSQFRSEIDVSLLQWMNLLCCNQDFKRGCWLRKPERQTQMDRLALGRVLSTFSSERRVRRRFKLRIPFDDLRGTSSPMFVEFP